VQYHAGGFTLARDKLETTPIMTNTVHIRRLLPSDAIAFQALRLRGLLESPTAFGSSHEEEVDHPTPAIAESLAEGSGRNMFGAFIDMLLIGIVGIGRETSLKERHRGFVRSMYVAPEARRQGVGKDLMGEALQFATSIPGLRQLTLAVTAGNSAAINLYEGFGFKICGTAPEALYVHGRYHDELQMVCRLGES
jgi:ribosomal protein S18 acetylase RimI-like enzyme